VTAKNIAVVGAGYWGRNIIRNFAELGVLHTICDSSEGTLSQYSSLSTDLRCTTEFGSVLRDPYIDGVVIATPASTHYSLTLQALKAGKDVFVEKPLALTTSEGSHLVRVSQEGNRVLLVGHLLEYHPALTTLGEMLRAGDLGKLLYVYSNRLNLGKFRTEENILWSFAPHDIAAILGMVEDELPTRLSAHGSAHLNPDVPDITLTNLEFSHNVRAHIYVSWLHPFKEQRLVVVGSQGMAELTDTEPEHKLKVYDHHVQWVGGVPTPIRANPRTVDYPQIEPLRNECEDFLRCIRDRSEPISSGPRALKVLHVLQSCQDSLDRHGDWIAPVTTRERDFFAHDSAIIDEAGGIGARTKIWHFTHLMPGVKTGTDCVIGQNVFVGKNVRIGNSVRVQNNVSIFEGVVLDDDVFCGPSCVFTNVVNPRSSVVRRDEFQPTAVKRGASIGANAVIVCGHTIGEYAFVGAGSVVTHDVPAHALVYGNPARHHGWVCTCGVELTQYNGHWECQGCGTIYNEEDCGLKPAPEDTQ